MPRQPVRYSATGIMLENLLQRRNWRWEEFLQKMGMSFEDFLQWVVVPSNAAPFILTWAGMDRASAVKFMARFFAKMFAEYDMNDPYFRLKKGVTSSFQFSSLAPRFSFLEFCTCLGEDPSLIEDIRNSPVYPKGSEEDCTYYEHHGEIIYDEHRECRCSNLADHYHRTIAKRGISQEDFVRMILNQRYNEYLNPWATTRFILTWASMDRAAAGEFMAHFLTSVVALYEDIPLAIDLLGSGHSSFYSQARAHAAPAVLRDLLPAWFSLDIREALGRFSEDLIQQDRMLVGSIRRCLGYPTGSEVDRMLFPSETVRLRRKVEAEARAEAEKKANEARIQDLEAKRKEEQERAEQSRQAHHIWREQFQQKPLAEQVHLIAVDEMHPVRNFPIEPNTFTAAVLAQLDAGTLEIDDGTLAKLLSRISRQRHKAWKKLASRIDAIRKKI